MRPTISAQDIRDLQMGLLLGTRTEQDVLDVLTGWQLRASYSYLVQLDSLIAAIRNGDRAAEKVCWRAFECVAPYGFPSETPVGDWQFDPTTGEPLTRYPRPDTEVVCDV